MTSRGRLILHAATAAVIGVSLTACASVAAAPATTTATSAGAHATASGSTDASASGSAPASASASASASIAMSADDQTTYDRLRDSDLQGVIDVDLPAVHEAVRGDIVVVGPVAQVVVDEVADSVADLAPQVAELAGVPIKESALVVVPSDKAEFERWSGLGMADALGVTFGADARRASWTLLQPGVDAADPQEVDIIVAHELFHQLTDLNPQVPGWLAEGFAEYAADQLAGEFERTMPRRAHLPTDAELRGSDRVADAAYFLSAKFAAYLADTYGEEEAMRFYNDAADHGVDTVMKRDLGVTLPQAVAAWQKSYRPTPVVP